MKTRIQFSLFVLITFSTFVGCKSKRTVTAKDRAPRVVLENKETQPVVVSPPETPVEIPVEVAPPVAVEPARPNMPYKDVVANYITTYSEIAKQEMSLYGIPASITLAQGILESGAGRGELTRKAQNHFGIKCHSGWTGERVYHDDDKLQECFRKYTDPNTSFRDHSLFLSGRSRYRSLFDLDKDDYKGWAKGLRKAGYATDPKYPEKLISIIERYDLKRYDKEVLGNNVRKHTQVNTIKSSKKTHIVLQGDTLYSIAKKHHMTVKDLQVINGLVTNNISIGQTLYLQSQ